MSNQHVDDLLRRVWVAQPTQSPPPPLNVLKRKAFRAQLQFAVRNAVEYLAVLAVAVMAFARLFTDDTLLMRLGNLLLMTGMLYVMVQLHLRASARRPPQDGTATDYLAFLRLELSRQATALRTVWRWYLIPFVPGILVINVAAAIEDGGSGWLVNLGLFAALLIAAHFLIGLAAERLARRLANLEAAVRDDVVQSRSPTGDPGADPG